MPDTVHLMLAAGMWLAPVPGAADFVDEFGPGALAADPSARDGWAWQAGDGEARVSFTQADGAGRIEVDASADRRNIWWAFVRRAVTPAIDASELTRPDRELRVQARVRTSVAPRRVNLHFNHSRTTDFHSHLMEYDLAEAGVWQDISLTTRDFDASAGDEVFVQLALMDWGGGHYAVDIDRIEVRVVDPGVVGPDRGSPLPYRPPARPPEDFTERLPVAADAVVDPSCRVIGYDGLRVCDASVMPDLPRANPHLTTVVIAERVAAGYEAASSSSDASWR